MTRETRAGFSALELTVVLAVMAILTSIAVPSILPAIRRSEVGAAAASIEQVASHARTLAMAEAGGGNEAWGVVVMQSPSGGAVVALTHGPVASPANVVEAGSAAALRFELGPNIQLWTTPGTGTRPSTTLADGWTAATPLDGHLGWTYQARSGFPLGPGGDVIAVGVGRSDDTETTTSTGEAFQWPSPLADHLSVRSLDGRHGVACSVYGYGGFSRSEAD